MYASTMETAHIYVELNIFFKMSMTFFTTEGCIKKFMCEAFFKKPQKLINGDMQNNVLEITKYLL